MNQGFFDPLARSFEVILDLLPRIFALIAVLAIGLIVAWLVRRVILWLLNLVKLDTWGRRLGLEHTFAVMRVGRPLPVLIGDALYGLVLVVFLVVGLDALDPASPGTLVTAFYGFLPKILVALLILILGYVVSVFVSQWVLIAAVTAQWRPARGIATGVQFLVLILALSMALDQLGVARGIVVAAFALSFGGVVLALGLAFGIGGADLAKRALEERLGRPKDKEDPKGFYDPPPL
jgi:hypothetical protein